MPSDAPPRGKAIKTVVLWETVKLGDPGGL
jgi:hypothetical protein